MERPSHGKKGLKVGEARVAPHSPAVGQNALTVPGFSGFACSYNRARPKLEGTLETSSYFTSCLFGFYLNNLLCN